MLSTRWQLAPNYLPAHLVNYLLINGLIRGTGNDDAYHRLMRSKRLAEIIYAAILAMITGIPILYAVLFDIAVPKYRLF